MADKVFTKKELCRLFEITETEFDSMEDNPDQIKNRYLKADLSADRGER